MNFKILLVCLLFILSSCDNSEVRGFYSSHVDGDTRFEQSMEWNQQHGYSELDIPQNEYSLYLMGDSHVGGTKNLAAFFAEAIEKDATAAVLLGDLTSGHKEDYEKFAENLPSKEALTYFAIVGNHDLFFDGWKSYYATFGSSSYYFTANTPAGSDLYICLDSGGGTLGKKQFDWFKKLLETRRNNYRYCTVFSHNNLFSLGQGNSLTPMIEEVHVLLDLFTRYRVNIVGTAHDHEKNSLVLGNTTHIVVDDLQDEDEKNSYVRLTISEEKIDYSFIEL